MWLRTISIFFLLLMVSSLCAQTISREDFVEQRQLERRGKIQAFSLKASIADLITQNSDQHNYDAKYYQLNLTINPSDSSLAGSVLVQGKSLVSDFREVVLDLTANMNVTSVTGDATLFSHQGDKLVLTLGNPLSVGENFSIEVNYNGKPQEGGFGGFVFDSQEGQPLVWTLSEPYFARGWWPCKDIPSDKADSVDIIVTVPSDLFAASNGKLISEVINTDGTKTFHWQERYPITTYLVSLAITNYAKFTQWFKYSPTDSMEITNYVYPQNLISAQTSLERLPAMLDFFHQTFGPYPFLDEKYGIAQFGWSGGMEHQTLSSQSSFGWVLTAHELAHQWWGDMITNANWSEIWLNEGFASYSEALYYEHLRGSSSYHNYMDGMDWEYSGSIYRADTTSAYSIFNGIVYDKGAWVLHMLRHVVSDSTFFEILKAYGNDPRFKFGNATTDGLKDVCEAVSGVELDWFFEQWIFGTSRPHYSYLWEIQANEDDARIDLTIDQTQVAGDRFYVMPIDVLLESANRDTLITVFNDEAAQHFSILLPFEPTNVTLDPNNWVLKRIVSPEPPEDTAPVPTQLTLIQNYPNPFNAGTTISFELNAPTAAELEIFNISGQLVRNLVKGYFSQGIHPFTWDGKNDKGETLSSGIYVYQITGSGFKTSRKLVFIK